MNPQIIISSRQRFLQADRALLKKTLSGILSARKRQGSLSVALVDDEEIRRVHREFLGDDTATDVISFLYDDGDRQGQETDGAFGELVISAETAAREARRRGLAPQAELLRYAIHGLLHLLGYDDTTPAARRQMKALERRYLASAIQPPPRRRGPR